MKPSGLPLPCPPAGFLHLQPPLNGGNLQQNVMSRARSQASHSSSQGEGGYAVKATKPRQPASRLGIASLCPHWGNDLVRAVGSESSGTHAEPPRHSGGKSQELLPGVGASGSVGPITIVLARVGSRSVGSIAIVLARCLPPRIAGRAQGGTKVEEIEVLQERFGWRPAERERHQLPAQGGTSSSSSSV